MRKLNFSALFLITALSVGVRSNAADFDGVPQFASLKSDQSSYTIGAKSLLTIYTQIQPTDTDYEIAYTAKLADQSVKVTQVGNTQSVAVSAPLSVAGILVWSVNVYLQDKSAAADINAAIVFYQNEITTTQALLAKETDPQKISILKAIIARDLSLVMNANTELSKVRRLIETDSVSIIVKKPKVDGSELIGVRSDGQPAFQISANQNPPAYKVGQQATFSVHVLTDFSGWDGTRENVVRAQLDNNAVGVVQSGADDFSSMSAKFVSADVGKHSFQATLYTRSKAQADSIRGAIDSANQRVISLILFRDGTSDPLFKLYYQSLIDDLTSTISSLYAQLESSLLLVGQQALSFTVTAS